MEMAQTTPGMCKVEGVYGRTTQYWVRNSQRTSSLFRYFCTIIEAKKEDTLYLGVEIHCVSFPHLLVTACSSCQGREAKRVARKIAARVRPVHSEGEEVHPIPDVILETLREGSLESGIILFNCAEILDFSTGSINLPLRITCYCRHHRERVGFWCAILLPALATS